MSVRFDASGDYYEATSGLPASTVWTATMWAKQVVAGTEQMIFQVSDNPPGSQNVLLSDGTTSDFGLWDFSTYSGPPLGQLTFSTATWYRIGIVVNGVNIAFYRATAAGDLTPVTAANWTASGRARMRIGYSTIFFNGEVAAFKMWQAALTTGEVTTELAQFDPARTANLLRYHKFKVAETTDYSGNGNALTSNGTPTTGSDDPPIPDVASNATLRLPIQTIQIP